MPFDSAALLVCCSFGLCRCCSYLRNERDAQRAFDPVSRTVVHMTPLPDPLPDILTMSSKQGDGDAFDGETALDFLGERRRTICCARFFSRSHLYAVDMVTWRACSQDSAANLLRKKTGTRIHRAACVVCFVCFFAPVRRESVPLGTVPYRSVPFRAVPNRSAPDVNLCVYASETTFSQCWHECVRGNGFNV